METQILKINRNKIDESKIKIAAEVINEGGLVAFPTETVYGLGANALDEAAVESIFSAKGRPADNPLIVHVCAAEDVKNLVKDVPDKAQKLMKLFWPGPLTILFSKASIVPSIVTAGLQTVGIRMPSHPVALSLLKHSGVPIAAPSANLSGKPSPTDACHVIDDLSGKINAIIDSGRVDVGLESTFLDITVNPPVILRPGAVTYEQLKDALGEVEIDPALTNNNFSGIPKSPGMKYTHYSPEAEVVIIKGRLSNVIDKINELVAACNEKNNKAGVLATEQTRLHYKNAEIVSMGDRDKPETIASNIFAQLRELDERKVEYIFAEAIDDSGIGLAIMNRLVKAAGYNIINV